MAGFEHKVQLVQMLKVSVSFVKAFFNLLLNWSDLKEIGAVPDLGDQSIVLAMLVIHV